MQKQILLGVLFIVSTINLDAQFDERHERFQNQKIAFFTEKLNLTPQEAEKFWPLYNDYNKTKLKLEEESRNSLRFMHRDSDNISEKDANEQLNKYIISQKEIHKIFLDFHQRYLEILPPQKVARIYSTEIQFRTFLLNQIREVRQERNPRKF